MRAALRTIREDFVSGRHDADRYQRLYNGLVDAKDDLYREVVGSEPPDRGDRV